MRSLLVVALMCVPAAADPLADVVRARLAPNLPAGLGIAELHATDEVAPETIAVEPPREIHAGRQSVRVYVKGKPRWLPVTFAPIVHVAVARRALAIGDLVTAADLAFDDRASAGNVAPADTLIGATVVHPIASDAIVGARDVTLPAPVGRGTAVTVEVRRGSVRVHGSGTLELAARIGQPASVRLTGGKLVVHGTLLASNVVVIGDAP